VQDYKRILTIVEKINYLKYLGILEHPLAKMLIENARNGTQSCLKLIPSSSQHGILAKRQSKIYLTTNRCNEDKLI
jgi:hypothetical protein